MSICAPKLPRLRPEKSHVVVEGPFVDFQHRSIGLTDAEVVHPAGDIATLFIDDELRFLSPVAADVGQPVEGSGSPDGSQTVPVWIIFKTRARRSGYSRSGLFQLQSETLWLLPQTADRSTGSREGHGLAKFIFALGGLGELGIRAEVLFHRVEVTGLHPSPLPHHPACGCTSLSLALRAASRLACPMGRARCWPARARADRLEARRAAWTHGCRRAARLPHADSAQSTGTAFRLFRRRRRRG